MLVTTHVGIGGYASWVRYLGDRLAHDGHTSAVLVVGRGTESSHVVPQRSSSMVLSATRRRVFSKQSYLRYLTARIDEYKPDVLYVNNSPWAQACLPYLPPGPIRIAVAHSNEPKEIAVTCANSEWLHYAIGVAPSIVSKLRERVSTSMVKLVPCCVPVSSRNRSVSRGILRLVYVGRLTNRMKNVRLIPVIAQQLARRGVCYHWTVVGDGEERANLERAAAELGLGASLSFVGARPPSEVTSILHDSDVLVLTSESEGLPHALLEAMECGVVPVVSRIPGSTDYAISDKSDGFLCQHDAADTFVDAIAAVDGDRERLLCMGSAAQKHARATFADQQVIEAHYALWESARSRSLSRRLSRHAFTLDPVLAEACPNILDNARTLLRRRISDAD